MGSGNFSRRATFQRMTQSDDGYGNTAISWDDLMTVWADVRETPGKEMLAAGRIAAPRTATVRIRRSTNAMALTEADRMLLDGRPWNIRSIAEVGRAREVIDLLCEIGVAA